MTKSASLRGLGRCGGSLSAVCVRPSLRFGLCSVVNDHIMSRACKCPAIGYPITPSPKKATFATAIPPVIGFLVVSLCVTGCKGLQNGGVTRMKNLFHWMLRLTTAAIVLATIAVIFAFYLAWRSLPQYDKTLQVTGITEHVEIVRDTANVPHIFGANDADVFFGLGYAHAQDRLWQMTILRRTVQGRLSEIFGPRTSCDRNHCAARLCILVAHSDV
jgi:hypothetical protein